MPEPDREPPNRLSEVVTSPRRNSGRTRSPSPPPRALASSRLVWLSPLLLALVPLLGTALAPAPALARTARIAIESPRDGNVGNDPTPRFRGTTDDTFDELEEEVLDPIAVEITDGAGVTHSAIAAQSEFNWSVEAEPLADGTYTARAIQRTPDGEEVGRSEPPITFAIDTTPPQISLGAAEDGTSGLGSRSVGGSAGASDGDLPAVRVQLFAGASVDAQPPLETLVVQASHGAWGATFGGLGPGTYTAVAQQSDRAGNTGTSAPITFAVAGAPLGPAPTASFKWFPQTPRTGETVSFVSSSTDAFSAITGFAWAPSDGGGFVAGKPVLTTAFATPGSHVVRLRVTNAEGRSSIATATVPVTGRALALMQPFPIVRIAGSLTGRGARIKLLTVQAPLGARVTVTCKGHGCGTKAESRLASASSTGKSRTGVALLSFRRFERSLGAGAVVRILVSKSGKIGKMTSFSVRRRKLPVRFDACLSTPASKPIRCPVS